MTIDNILEQHEFIFKLLGNNPRWTCVNVHTDLLPANVMDILGFEIPDHCVFIRFRDYERGIGAEFRQYTSRSIRINAYAIG